jgi:hypothetical protein
VSEATLYALGAFLSGVGSAASAFVAIKAIRKRMQKECEERMNALREGIRIGRER